MVVQVSFKVRLLLVFCFSVCAFLFLLTGKSAALSGAPSNLHPDTTYGAAGDSYMIVQVTGNNVPNANNKMKARSTIANIYVPKTRAGQVISFTIIGGCGGSTRDNDTGYGSTDFRIERSGGIDVWTTNSSCNNGGDVLGSFTAVAPPASDLAHIVEGYYIYNFHADGNMSETSSATKSRRYLNAFQFRADTAGVRVGISDVDDACDSGNYPISCPSNGRVFSSYYGPWNRNPWGQKININNTCNSTGSITLYDLDASDATLGQNITIQLLRAGQPINVTALNGLQLDTLPHAAVQAWGPGIPGVLRSHPGYGGNNNEYMLLPGSDPMVAGLGSFDANVSYDLIIDGLSDGNAIQIQASMTHCQEANTPDPTCSITSVTNMAFGAKIFPGQQFRFNVTTTNASGYVLGVNGPAWGNPGAWDNYLVAGNQYIRTPVPVSGPQDVTLYRFGDSGPWDQAFVAPNTPGSYSFNWGLVVPGVSWAPSGCSATLVVWPPDQAACEGTATVTSGAVVRGQPFTTRVSIKNTGTTTWTPGTWSIASAINRTNNYLTNGGGEIRGGTVSGNIAPGSIADFDIVNTAPNAIGTYPYFWLMVHEGVTWFGDSSCGTNFTTVNPPDTPPSVTIDQSCSNPFTITITVSDPNYNENPGQALVNYTVDGVARAAVRTVGAARTYTFDMTDPTVGTIVSASSVGVNPNPPGGDGPASSNRSSGDRTFGKCADRFTVSPSPQLPVLDDSELPTTVSFTSYINLTTNGSKLNGGASGIVAEREYFYNRGGSFDSATGIFTGVGSCTYAPGLIVNNSVGLPAVGSNNVLTTETRPAVATVPCGNVTTVQAGDMFCQRFKVTPQTGLMSLSGDIFAGTTSGSASTNNCIVITDKPYVKVFGSDVLAGSGFGSTCSGMPNANITTYARSTGGGWVGGGTQFGVFASGIVSGFASSSVSAPSTPSSRVFANTGALGSVFGGLFGSPTCADDFWASKSTSVGVTATVPLNALSSATPVVAPGQYQFAAGSNISAAAAVNGKIAVFVDGDATITSDITTSTGPWASTAAIPSVYLVVRGNIYIAPNVTRLDGIYVAMPRVPASNLGNPADGGRIFTCTDNGAAPTNAALLGACRTNRLVVNGAFTAKHVNFLRTAGSLRGATTAAVPQPATCTAANPVTIYTDYKFLGTSRTLAAGSYIAGAATAPVGYRQISSVKVPAGCRAVLLDETTGQSKDLYADWTVVDGSSPFNDATTRIDVTSIPASQRQLGLLWSITGPIEPANYDCALFDEPSDSWWTGVYADNYLCARKSYNLGLTFSANGPIAGKTCVLVYEPGETKVWANDYLCSNANLGIQYTANGGSIGIAGMYCTSAVHESGDTHMTPVAWWLDNYLCEPLAPVPASPAIIGETSASTNISEIFNFTPDMLMSVPSPTTTLTIGSFDSVISLPPSL